MRRRNLVLGAAGVAVTGWLAKNGMAQPPAVIDLTRYRRTFSAEFDDPNQPLSMRDGGPFTHRYEQWGGIRTLPANGELELYVDKAFVPAAGGTDKAGHADAIVGAGGAPGAPLGYDPFKIRDSCLEISAVPVPAALRGRVDRPYLSGLISTEWSFSQQYGYFEIRAQLPAGRGLWPAFWMVSNTSAEHVEIDILEAVGEGSRIYHSLHMSPARGKGTHLPRYPGFDYADGMHTYGVSWTETDVVFFIDGVESARADGAPLRGAPPMYLLANLAVGGSWAGTPPAATQFPAVMRVDYIRAYQAI